MLASIQQFFFIMKSGCFLSVVGRFQFPIPDLLPNEAEWNWKMTSADGSPEPRTIPTRTVYSSLPYAVASLPAYGRNAPQFGSIISTRQRVTSTISSKTMPTDPNISLVLMRNLPVSTATVTADYTFVAVAGNKNTVRVPWSTLAAGFITVSPAIPTGPTAPGTEGQITWDSTGVYTYTNGAWGKSPRLGTNWDDLTYDARFLLVNKIMSLSETEVANVLKTLGIGSATQEKAGLVTLATTMGENKGNVPTTAQVVDYVTEQLKEIEIGGGGGDKISAYQGGVDIKGPNGELILTYDSTARILYIGSGVDIVRSKTDTGVEYYGAGRDLKGAVDTQEDDGTP